MPDLPELIGGLEKAPTRTEGPSAGSPMSWLALGTTLTMWVLVSFRRVPAGIAVASDPARTSGHPAGAAHSSALLTPFLSIPANGLLMWQGMAATMLAPVVIPQCRRICATSPRPLVGFLSAYLAAWIALGSALLLAGATASLALRAVGADAASYAPVLAILATTAVGLYQFSATRRRCADCARCCRHLAIAERSMREGWLEGWSSATAGIRSWGPVMALLPGLGVHDPRAMLAVTVLMAAEGPARVRPFVTAVTGAALLLTAFVMASGAACPAVLPMSCS